MSQEDLGDIYIQDIKTRHLLFRDVDFTIPIYYSTKSIILSASLIFKVLLSRIIPYTFFERPNEYNSIGISWARLHTQRLKDKQDEIENVIEYFYSNYSLLTLSFYRDVPICSVFSEARKLKIRNIEHYDEKYFYDSFFYRIIFVIDFYALKNVLERYKPENVYCAGLCDRLAIILTTICGQSKIKVHMMQHGLLSLCKGKIKRKVHAFYYLYDFSLQAIKYSIRLDTSPHLIYLPKKQGALKLSHFDESSNKNIAYATAIVKHEFNVQIIETTLRHMPKDFNLLIYIHPLDKRKKYEQYRKLDNVFLFKKERHSNIEYLISRISTLGLEYYELGVPSIFVNLDNLAGLFFHIDLFTTFYTLEEYEKWLKNTIRVE